MNVTPGLSVIVCTYNREKYIKETMLHLKNQKGVSHDEFEVIVVNNNSSDKTADVCKSFIETHELINFLYFNEEKQGHTYARNRGIKESKGELIAFLDDDAFAASDYVKNIVSFFSLHTEVLAIGGKIEPVYESKEPIWMSNYLLPLVAALDLGDKPILFAGNKFPIGANMAFRKIAFDKYGLFDTNLGRRGKGLEGGDEKEIFTRIRKGNEVIYYVPQVKVKHVIPESRIQNEYIKNMAIGVGTSEKKRLKNSNHITKINRIIEELTKIAGTIVLFFLFSFKGRLKAAFMLIKFRVWVINGFLKF